MLENKKIDWENKSNSTIKHELVALDFEHKSVVRKIEELSNKLEFIEKEYIIGTKIINKRLKGE
tara:strand:+ start:6436 stop:6627 length:192 start_codon:yes stop_codon:yes gene_type:complete